MLRSIPFSVASALVLLATPAAFSSIVIDGYTNATNDRFTNSPSFIASSFDLSGVGQTDGRWATAISSNVVISAFHFQPSGTVYFYPGNNPLDLPVTRQVTFGSRVGSTDLYLAVLDQNLPASIAHYEFATAPLMGPQPVGSNITITNAGPYQDLDAYVFGRSPFDENSDPARFSYNDQAVGRNKISGYSENVPFNGDDNDSIIMFRDTLGDPNYVPFETLFQSGDSGGPTFVDIGGTLVLLGTNAYNFDDLSGGGINYVGNQASFINAFIATNAVPEPSSTLVLSGLIMSCVLRRRRTREPRNALLQK